MQGLKEEGDQKTPGKEMWFWVLVAEYSADLRELLELIF